MTTANHGDGGLRDAPLTEADAEAALALSAEASWNQTAADWRLMIGRGEALGCFAAADGGERLVGSALLLPYGGRVAWLAMVLVAADHRRRGIATRLVGDRLARADALGWAVGLDATPAGREVYRRLGFGDAFGLHRLAGDLRAPPAGPPPGAEVRPLAPADLAAVAALDAAAFGADRTALLAYLRAAWPERALVATGADGGIRGFAFVRRGRAAHHLGPLAGDDPALAPALAARALAGLRGRAVADVPDGAAAAPLRAWLEQGGFRPERPFTRMFRRGAAAARPGDPGRLLALAGPEFG